MTGTNLHPNLRAYQDRAATDALQAKFESLARARYPDSRGPLEAVVKHYIAYGSAFGFARAEGLLAGYLPDDKPDGVCGDIRDLNQLARFFIAMHDELDMRGAL